MAPIISYAGFIGFLFCTFPFKVFYLKKKNHFKYLAIGNIYLLHTDRYQQNGTKKNLFKFW